MSTDLKTEALRNQFEQWYIERGAFEPRLSPLGSRECELQWNAWLAALAAAGGAEPVAAEPMFLIVAGGDNISTEIVPQPKLDEAYLLTQWGSLDPADADQHREALEHFHDADEWQYMDPLRGGKDRVATIFHLNLEGDWVSVYRLPDAAPTAQPQPQPEPIDMVLHCPNCGLQHIDDVEELPMPVPGSMFEGSAGWTNPPHRSHLCHGCGHIWRPADVPTNGVQAVKTCGKADHVLFDDRTQNQPQPERYVSALDPAMQAIRASAAQPEAPAEPMTVLEAVLRANPLAMPPYPASSEAPAEPSELPPLPMPIQYEHREPRERYTAEQTQAYARSAVAAQWVDWVPTTKAVNALPAVLRNYVHGLETRCDPAGLVRDNAIKTDLVRALEASNRSLRDQLAAVAQQPAELTGWKLVKQSRLDEITKYAADPSEPCYEGRGLYDDREVRNNWSRCASNLDAIACELRAIRDGDDDEDLAEAQEALKAQGGSQ